MWEIYQQLIVFFGLDTVPATFAEFVPWFMSVLVAIGLFLFVFNFVRLIVSNLQRVGRW